MGKFRPTCHARSSRFGPVRIPTEPHTSGDYIRRRRLGLTMIEREVAEQIDVDETTAFNWEANTTSPEIRYMSAIIEFLGYNPVPDILGRHMPNVCQ